MSSTGVTRLRSVKFVLKWIWSNILSFQVSLLMPFGGYLWAMMFSAPFIAMGFEPGPFAWSEEPHWVYKYVIFVFCFPLVTGYCLGGLLGLMQWKLLGAKRRTTIVDYLQTGSTAGLLLIYLLLGKEGWVRLQDAVLDGALLGLGIGVSLAGWVLWQVRLPQSVIKLRLLCFYYVIVSVVALASGAALCYKFGPKIDFGMAMLFLPATAGALYGLFTAPFALRFRQLVLDQKVE